ncbi:conserved hypothetical protein [Caulobacter segnis ATCC 21756]|uniref:Transmembrane protein n=2 Tax=Caulobacter segnis TaxID=88688 RepID=D5VME7_CAUST|nr:conserved hypothetical protein [Caulobacter segnis ATCC 21756]
MSTFQAPSLTTGKTRPLRDRTSLAGASPCAAPNVTLPVRSAHWSHRFHMQSTFAFAAFVTTGLAAVAAMSCAVSMWNMINQIKTVRVRTGQNRRKQR